MQKELRMNLAAGMCAGAAEEKMGNITLKTLVEENKFPGMDEVTKMIAEFGVGWVKESRRLHDALRKNPAEIAEINRLIARLTISQIFALIGAFGMQAFVYGSAVLFQECWKRQYLQQTLMVMIITIGRVKELLDLCEFCDAVLLKKATSSARRATTYFKSQVIELFLILQTSDTQMKVDGNGITSLGNRAYLMNALPHALAKAFCVYVTLNHEYYASAYYPEVPLDWIAKSRRVILSGYSTRSDETSDGVPGHAFLRLSEDD